MEINKVVFLCLILLFVLVLSNYFSQMNEGFRAKKKSSSTKAPTTKPPSSAASAAIAKENADRAVKAKTDIETLVRSNEESNNKVLEQTATIKQNVIDTATTAESLKTKIAKIDANLETSKKNSDAAITTISDKAANVDKSVEANKLIKTEIETKVAEIDPKLTTIKNYADSVTQIKKDVDTAMNDFQINSAAMLKTIQLAIDKFDSAKLASSAPTATVQGFQNMDKTKDDLVAAGGFKLLNSSESANIDAAYDGTLMLEGFGTPMATISATLSPATADSVYLKNANLFDLEKDVIDKLKVFNDAYLEYHKCLREKRTNPATDCTAKLASVRTAANNVNTAAATLNAALVNANADGTPDRRVSKNEFITRHAEIKRVSDKIREVRYDLDSKMAELLDKSKGPLPEAQTRYNFENYTMVAWSVLATSILYYTFVKME
jgi:DNA integrity scanning protein DisA with diadenylate cyclase activity